MILVENGIIFYDLICMSNNDRLFLNPTMWEFNMSQGGRRGLYKIEHHMIVQFGECMQFWAELDWITLPPYLKGMSGDLGKKRGA